MSTQRRQVQGGFSWSPGTQNAKNHHLFIILAYILCRRSVQYFIFSSEVLHECLWGWILWDFHIKWREDKQLRGTALPAVLRIPRMAHHLRGRDRGLDLSRSHAGWLWLLHRAGERQMPLPPVDRSSVRASEHFPLNHRAPNWAVQSARSHRAETKSKKKRIVSRSFSVKNDGPAVGGRVGPPRGLAHLHHRSKRLQATKQPTLRCNKYKESNLT